MAALASLRDEGLSDANLSTTAEARPAKSRHRGAFRNGVAVLAAGGLHLAILGFVGLSWSKTSIPLDFAGDQASVFASLTPASALEPASAASSPQPSAFDKLSDSLTDTVVSPPKPSTQTFADHLLDQMDATKPASQPAKALSAHAAPASAASPSVALQDADNPWKRASSLSTDPSFVQKLWSAIKPCWKGDYAQAASSIRVVLDVSGEVKAMTSLSGGGAREKAQAQQSAQAILACAPYRIGTAGAFLVRAPA